MIEVGEVESIRVVQLSELLHLNLLFVEIIFAGAVLNLFQVHVKPISMLWEPDGTGLNVR